MAPTPPLPLAGEDGVREAFKIIVALLLVPLL
jgi:hypothetical protein